MPGGNKSIVVFRPDTHWLVDGFLVCRVGTSVAAEKRRLESLAMDFAEAAQLHRTGEGAHAPQLVFHDAVLPPGTVIPLTSR